jgi:hypothetical protein
MLSLYLDEDSMDRDLVRALRRAGIDVLTVAEAGRRGVVDEQQLAFATSGGRTLYTCNVTDFARLHSYWLRHGLHHAGVVLLTEQLTPIGTQIGALLRLTSALNAETMRDRLEFLSNWYTESK